MLQDAGGMFDGYGVVLLLCSNASAFTGVISPRLCGRLREGRLQAGEEVYTHRIRGCEAELWFPRGKLYVDCDGVKGRMIPVLPSLESPLSWCKSFLASEKS